MGTSSGLPALPSNGRPTADAATAPPSAARPLWDEGGFRLCIGGGAGGKDRVIVIDRPFALLGRLPGNDARIDDPAVSGRHLYMHMDRRGLFAVDLATRSGTRFGGRERTSAWLRPGDAFEIAGHRVELLGLDFLDGSGFAAEAAGAANLSGPADLLAHAGGASLARLTLFPRQPPNAPMTLGSELVFLGRGACCGVQVEAETAARIHCALIRTRTSAFAVDLVGRGVWLNNRPVHRVCALNNGDSLMVSTALFDVRVEPPTGYLPVVAARPSFPAERAQAHVPPRPAFPAEMAPPQPPAWPSPNEPYAAPFPAPTPTWPTTTPDAQTALLAWMMGMMQAQQGEAIRQQTEFQQTMTGMVQRMQRDQETLILQHKERSDAIQRELAILREEIQRRLGPAAPAGSPALPAPKPIPLRLPDSPPPVSPDVATSWLIERVGQLEEENRSTWKDLLGRMTGNGRRSP